MIVWIEILEQALMNEQFKERFIEIVSKAKGDRSQAQFAHEIGVSSAAVQKWLSGGGFPSSENLEKIAKAAGLSGIDALRNYLKGETPHTRSDAPKAAEEVLPLVQKLDKEQRKRLIELLLRDF